MMIIILYAHFLADFVFQTRYMAENKSKSIKVLSLHILEYFSIMLIALYFFDVSILFIAWNSIAHFVVDYFTSKLTSKLWAEKRVHDFFVVIGFDQFLHVALLTWSYGRF